MIAFYGDFIHYSSSSRRKLSVHLTSQRKTPTKFSAEASEALLKVLKQENLPVEEEQYRQLSAAQPPLESVLEFWKKQLESHESSASVLVQIPEIAAQYPVEGTIVDLGFPEGATRITNVAIFKARMTASNAPTPIDS